MRRAGSAKNDHKPSLLPSSLPPASRSLLDLPLMSTPSKKSKTKSKFFAFKPAPIQPSSKTSPAPALVVPLSSACSDASASTLSSASAPRTLVDDREDARSTLTSIPDIASTSSVSTSSITSKWLSFLRGGKGKSRKSEGNKGKRQGLMDVDEQPTSDGQVTNDGADNNRTEKQDNRAPSSLLSIPWRPRFQSTVSRSSSYVTPSPIAITRSQEHIRAVCVGDEDDDEDEEDESDDDDDEDDESGFRPVPGINPSHFTSTPTPAAPGPAAFMLYPPSPTKSTPSTLSKDRPTPRSHIQLTQLTYASLQVPPSAHPLVIHNAGNTLQGSALFPRSCNPSSKLSNPPDYLIALHKNRTIQRLERNNLTAAEELSIMPFATGRVGASRAPEANSRSGYHPPASRNILLRSSLAEEDPMRRLDISPTTRGTGPSLYSQGTRRWLQRPSFASRNVEWKDYEEIGFRWIVISRSAQSSPDLTTQSLQFSKWIRALAGCSTSLTRSLGNSSGANHLPRLLIPPVPSLSSSPSPSGATSTAPATPKSNRALHTSGSRLKITDDDKADDDIPLGKIRLPQQELRIAEEQRRKELERERLKREKEKAVEKEARKKKQYAEEVAAARVRRESYRAGMRPPSMTIPHTTPTMELDCKPEPRPKTHISQRSTSGEPPSPSRKSKAKGLSRPMSLMELPRAQSLFSPMGVIPPLPTAPRGASSQETPFQALPVPHFPYTSSRRSHSPASSHRTSVHSEGRSRRMSIYTEFGQHEKTHSDDGRSFRSLPRSYTSPLSSSDGFVVPPLPPLPANFHALQPNNLSSPTPDLRIRAMHAHNSHSRRSTVGDLVSHSDRDDASSERRSRSVHRLPISSRPRTIIS